MSFNAQGLEERTVARWTSDRRIVKFTWLLSLVLLRLKSESFQVSYVYEENVLAAGLNAPSSLFQWCNWLWSVIDYGNMFNLVIIHYNFTLIWSYCTWLPSTVFIDGMMRWHFGRVAVHSCRVHRETVETFEETCDWALTVTSRSLWTTSSRRWCRLFPLHWQRVWRKVHGQVLRSWRPMFPTGTRSALVWRSYVGICRCSLKTTTYFKM